MRTTLKKIKKYLQTYVITAQAVLQKNLIFFFPLWEIFFANKVNKIKRLLFQIHMFYYMQHYCFCQVSNEK